MCLFFPIPQIAQNFPQLYILNITNYYNKLRLKAHKCPIKINLKSINFPQRLFHLFACVESYETYIVITHADKFRQ